MEAVALFAACTLIDVIVWLPGLLILHLLLMKEEKIARENKENASDANTTHVDQSDQ